jgi:hypothetical protein
MLRNELCRCMQQGAKIRHQNHRSVHCMVRCHAVHSGASCAA